ncbi:MAG: hypothetical protein HY842_06090 [Bacteroidetes bacterium]|nr:hypothetical protein [Bacteroidota bacterium]
MKKRADCRSCHVFLPKVHPFKNCQFVRTDGGYAVMDDGATVSVARHRKEEFLELFSKF